MARICKTKGKVEDFKECNLYCKTGCHVSVNKRKYYSPLYLNQGIRKQKRGRKLWDETSQVSYLLQTKIITKSFLCCKYLLQTWKPRWGFKRANDKTNEWLIEVPANAGKNVENLQSMFPRKI